MNMRRRPQVLIFAVCALLLAGCAFPTWMFRAPPRRGRAFPELKLPVPASQADRQYLNTGKETGTFALEDCQGDLVLVFVFDMYCRYCQEGAAQIATVHIELGRRNLTERVKVIGLAMDNSEFEATLYRYKYQIGFPIVPDPEGLYRGALGRVAVPSFFAVDTTDGGRIIVASQSGVFEDGKALDDFLDRALRQAGIASK